jgi:hypothetical protein
VGSVFVGREGGCGGCRSCVIMELKRRSITSGSDLNISGCCIDNEVGDFDSIGVPSRDWKNGIESGRDISSRRTSSGSSSSLA